MPILAHPARMLIKDAKRITGGGLTKVSKMPCYTYNIPAAYCKTGGALRARGLMQIQMNGFTRITCAYCYTYKGQWTFPGVPQALQRRYETLEDPQWVDAMVTLIATRRWHGEPSRYFRWHSSGDIQSVQHLRNICLVCELTPAVQHWLPTQERKITQDYLKQYGSFPENLCVRVSAVMLGGVAGTYRN